MYTRHTLFTFHGLAISLGTLQGKHREMEGKTKRQGENLKSC
jgi:hypothetical protein